MVPGTPSLLGCPALLWHLFSVVSQASPGHLMCVLYKGHFVQSGCDSCLWSLAASTFAYLIPVLGELLRKVDARHRPREMKSCF